MTTWQVLMVSNVIRRYDRMNGLARHRLCSIEGYAGDGAGA